jgi:DUF4097 and DUF4098 domain-containing protein YvlB
VPTFPAPKPVLVALDISAGQLSLVADDRSDAVVNVSPGGPAPADAKMAEQAQVAYSGGVLRVTTPKPRGLSSVFGWGSSVHVEIRVPTGSDLNLTMAKGEVTARGTFGEFEVSMASGHIELDRAATLRATVSDGKILAEHITASAEISGSSADVRIRTCGGRIAFKNANGTFWLGDVQGDVDVSTANGDIGIGQAAADVIAKTANGNITVGELTRGETYLTTARGTIDVGIRLGSVARVDARSTLGAVHNELTVHGSPEDFDERIKLRARSWSGNIVIRRATPNSSTPAS